MGVLIVHYTGLPLPASVIGLILLAACLQFKLVKVDYIREGAGFLLAFMTLFFIPPMIGIIDYPELLSLHGVILMIAVFLSTMFTIFITSTLSEKIEKKELAVKEKKDREGEGAIESSHIHH